MAMVGRDIFLPK